jgi:hypothetical protein
MFRALARRCLADYDSFGEISDMPQDAWENELDLFLMMSARMSGVNGADFELIAPNDDVAIIREKFVTYLNSAQLDLVDSIREQINQADTPSDPDLAPGAKPEGEV